MAYAPYPIYPSYLDFVNLGFPTQVVRTRTPRISTQGVMPSEVSEVGAGATAGPPSPDSPGLNVGQSAQAAAQSQGFTITVTGGGMISSARMGQMGAANVALALLGLPSIPGPIGTLFGLANNLAGRAAGLAIDPTTGLPTGSESFQALAQGAPYGSFFDPSSPAISPLAMATIGPISANQVGFSISPFSTGTPFSSNPVANPNPTNFGQRGGGDDPDGEGGNVGGGQPSGTGGTPSGGGSSPSGGEGGQAMRLGGRIRDTRPGGGDNEPRRLQAGEFVVRRNSAAKYRTLLEAINGDRPAEVKRLASKLRARFAA
jgi:hypothetical protein